LQLKNVIKINRQAIDRRIKQALEKAKPTQRTLAAESEVSADSVSGYADGFNEPNAAVLAQTGSFCRMSLTWLINGGNISGKESDPAAAKTGKDTFSANER
jgi:transcriptional regulator with XRE-family HTH domain